MASARQIALRRLDHVGSDGSISSGRGRKRGVNINLCDQRRRRIQVVGHRIHLLNALVKEFLFSLDGPFTGGEDFFFPSFEFFGDVALAVPQRLLAHPMRRHFLAVGVGDFDAVPKHTVEHHPQGRDVVLL